MAMGELVCISQQPTGQAIWPLQNQHPSTKSVLSCEFVKIDSLWNIVIKKTSGTWKLHQAPLQVESWRFEKAWLAFNRTPHCRRCSSCQIWKFSNILKYLSHPLSSFCNIPQSKHHHLVFGKCFSRNLSWLFCTKFAYSLYKLVVWEWFLKGMFPQHWHVTLTLSDSGLNVWKVTKIRKVFGLVAPTGTLNHLLICSHFHLFLHLGLAVLTSHLYMLLHLG